MVGLGPAGLDRPGPATVALLEDPDRRLLARTAHHPAVDELAARRPVETGDHLYEKGADLDDVYPALARWVLGAATEGDVVYAVPGSPLVGERSVQLLREAAAPAGVALEVVASESFLALVFDRIGLDPLARGVQVLDGRSLPDPLILHVPTVIAQVDRPLVLAGVHEALGRTLPGETPVTVMADLGGAGEQVRTVPLADLARQAANPRTTLFLDPPPSGWVGLVQTNRRLRAECPWDRDQTHHTLVNHLVEEAYEAVEALSRLGPEAPGGDPDYGAYAEVEEELGDLILQVVFHATLAAEAGAFDVEEVAEGIRRKLVHRHPHVFGEADVADAGHVLRNWEQLKMEEKGRESLLDGVPASLPALARAAKLQSRAASAGFDWPEAEPVLAKIVEEAEELRRDIHDPLRAADELGDLLFSAVNLARHLGVDPELALRRSADRFADRFRAMEAAAAGEGVSLADETLDELDRRWAAAKDAGRP